MKPKDISGSRGLQPDGPSERAKEAEQISKKPFDAFNGKGSRSFKVEELAVRPPIGQPPKQGK